MNAEKESRKLQEIVARKRKKERKDIVVQTFKRAK